MSTATPNIPDAPRTAPEKSWPAYAAVLWALVFFFFHTVWAAGWYVGLWPKELWRLSFQRTGVLIYDIVVAGACLLAVAVELALVQPWGRRVPRWLLGFLAWSGTGLLVLRGGGSVIQIAYRFLTGTFILEPMLVWELWFYLGAVLFVLSLWQYWRVPRIA